jgi:hypothetical protein
VKYLLLAFRLFVIMLCLAGLSHEVPLLQKDLKIAGAIGWLYRLGVVFFAIACCATAILYDFSSVSRYEKVIRLAIATFCVGSITMAVSVMVFSWIYRTIGV